MTTYSKPERRRRKSGKLSKHFLVRVYEDGRRTWRSTGCKTLAGARETVKAWEIREARAESGEREESKLTLHALLEAWFAAKKTRISYSCALVYESHLRTWLKGLPDQLVRTLGADVFETYLAKRLEEDRLRPRTLNNERAILRSVFNWAKRAELVDRNPLDGVERYREERRAVRVPSEEEEERLLVEARRSSEETYGFVLCLLESGLRRGTVTQLEWDDVDFEAREWRIPAAKMKSREDFTGRPVAPRLYEYLRARRRPAGRIFEPLSSQRFETASKRAGIPWLRPHDLRRAFVSRCRRKGLPLEVCMFLSDHRDVDTVMRSYRAIGREEVSEAILKLWAS